jgi:hypothetical protein
MTSLSKYSFCLFLLLLFACKKEDKPTANLLPKGKFFISDSMTLAADVRVFSYGGEITDVGIKQRMNALYDSLVWGYGNNRLPWAGQISVLNDSMAAIMTMAGSGGSADVTSYKIEYDKDSLNFVQVDTTSYGKGAIDSFLMQFVANDNYITSFSRARLVLAAKYQDEAIYVPYVVALTVRRFLFTSFSYTINGHIKDKPNAFPSINDTVVLRQGVVKYRLP